MIDILHNLISNDEISNLLTQPKIWDSLVINKRKPHTYRIFTMYNNIRICLHEFDECSTEESFAHPHAWPAAFTVLCGEYNLKIGRSSNTLDRPEKYHILNMAAESSYEMVDPLEWHAITPLRRTYTVMINGPNYENPHSMCRTTKGKDLEKLSEKEVQESLLLFSDLLKYK